MNFQKRLSVCHSPYPLDKKIFEDFDQRKFIEIIKAIDDKELDTLIEISSEEFSCYEVLNFFINGFVDEDLITPTHQYWLNFDRKSFKCLLVKPVYKGISKNSYKEYVKGKEQRVVAMECRLGSRENNTVIFGFVNRSDAIHFKLKNIIE